jgi:hypothetical protein
MSLSIHEFLARFRYFTGKNFVTHQGFSVSLLLLKSISKEYNEIDLVKLSFPTRKRGFWQSFSIASRRT